MAQRSATRMNRLIGDLVDVASIEAGRLAVTREIADPTQVVTEAVEIFQAQAAAGGIALSSEATLPPFPEARIRAGGIPSHGDVLDVDFDAVRRGEAYANVKRN